MTKTDVIRSKCLNDFNFFTRYFFKQLNGKKFVVNKHHALIFDKLVDIYNGKSNRDIINIAPRYSKTEIAVKMFISWSLANNPKARFIHLSYSDGLALDNSESIKNLITSQEYQELFPYVKIKVDSKAKEKWYTTEGGGVLARSSSGQVTGFGAGQTNYDNEIEEFGGAIIIDDPLKPDDAESDVLREKVNNRFDTTIRNRVNDRNTPIIVIMQRLHQNDLSGYLMEVEPDVWNVLSLPVIQEDGTALWEAKHTIEELNKLRAVNEFVFDTQYMQDPRPKEGMMYEKLNTFRRSDIDLKQASAVLSFIDIADEGSDNHAVPFGYLIGNKVFVPDVVFTKEGTDTNVLYSLKKINEHRPAYCQVESNFGGSMYIQLLKTQEEKLNGTTALIPIHNTGQKHTRIITMKGVVQNNFYFLAESEYEKGSEYDKFMVNLKDYRKKKGAVKHDDAPDSISGLAKMAVSYYPHLFDYFITE